MKTFLNYPLIFKLSLGGMAMAIGTVYYIPLNREPFFWLAIFLVCAYLIAKQANGRFFLHGFLVSMVNSVWVTAAHLLLFDTYMLNHPELQDMAAQTAVGGSVRLGMALMGPVYGAVSGLVLGLMALLAARLTRGKQ